MSFLKIIFFLGIGSHLLYASVPTEEGLLRNLNNADLPGTFITMRLMSQDLGEPEKREYIKLQISTEKPNSIALLQTVYSSGQMQNTQIRSIKYFPNIVFQIKKEMVPEKSLFYAIVTMLAANESLGMQAFLEKNGVSVVKNKNILNEEKMKLLRAYKNYLVKNKTRGDAGSPLNLEDAKEKEKNLELFRSNTFKKSKNIELVKRDKEFMWKVDWKSSQAFFTNEERRFRAIVYSTGEAEIKIEGSEYLLFNGTNELPKFLNLKDSKNGFYKMQVLGLDVKKTEGRLVEIFEEQKKISPQEITMNPFLF